MLPLITIREASYVEEIIEEIIKKVLTRELDNEFEVLKAYAMLKIESFVRGLSTKQEVDVKQIMLPALKPQTDNYNNLEFAKETYKESPAPSYYSSAVVDSGKTYERETTFSSNGDKFQNLENKIKELERRNLEIKLESDVNIIVGQNLEILKDMDYLDGPEKVMVSRALKKVYRGIITEVDPKLRVLKDSNKKEGNDINNEN
jgi:hypothetical protein